MHGRTCITYVHAHIWHLCIMHAHVSHLCMQLHHVYACTWVLFTCCLSSVCTCVCMCIYLICVCSLSADLLEYCLYSYICPFPVYARVTVFAHKCIYIYTYDAHTYVGILCGWKHTDILSFAVTLYLYAISVCLSSTCLHTNCVLSVVVNYDVCSSYTMMYYLDGRLQQLTDELTTSSSFCFHRSQSRKNTTTYC